MLLPLHLKSGGKRGWDVWKNKSAYGRFEVGLAAGLPSFTLWKHLGAAKNMTPSAGGITSQGTWASTYTQERKNEGCNRTRAQVIPEFLHMFPCLASKQYVTSSTSRGNCYASRQIKPRTSRSPTAELAAVVPDQIPSVVPTVLAAVPRPPS